MTAYYKHIKGIVPSEIASPSQLLSRTDCVQLADIACELVRKEQDHVVTCMIEEFDVQPDLMHWEDIAVYRRRRRAALEEKQQAEMREKERKRVLGLVFDDDETDDDW